MISIALYKNFGSSLVDNSVSHEILGCGGENHYFRQDFPIIQCCKSGRSQDTSGLNITLKNENGAK